MTQTGILAWISGPVGGSACPARSSVLLREQAARRPTHSRGSARGTKHTDKSRHVKGTGRRATKKTEGTVWACGLRGCASDVDVRVDTAVLGGRPEAAPVAPRLSLERGGPTASADLCSAGPCGPQRLPQRRAQRGRAECTRRPVMCASPATATVSGAELSPTQGSPCACQHSLYGFHWNREHQTHFTGK